VAQEDSRRVRIRSLGGDNREEEGFTFVFLPGRRLRGGARTMKRNGGGEQGISGGGEEKEDSLFQKSKKSELVAGVKSFRP